LSGTSAAGGKAQTPRTAGERTRRVVRACSGRRGASLGGTAVTPVSLRSRAGLQRPPRREPRGYPASRACLRRRATPGTRRRRGAFAGTGRSVVTSSRL